MRRPEQFAKPVGRMMSPRERRLEGEQAVARNLEMGGWSRERSAVLAVGKP
jgi:hypothetical protein